MLKIDTHLKQWTTHLALTVNSRHRLQWAAGMLKAVQSSTAWEVAACSNQYYLLRLRYKINQELSRY